MPFLPKSAPPPKQSIDNPDPIPEQTASFIDILTFGWLTPLLALGYARPLEAPDLPKLQDHRHAAYIGDRIIASFERRQKEAIEYNSRLANGEITPGWRGIWWSLRGNRVERERTWREKDGLQKASLSLALNDSVKW